MSDWKPKRFWKSASVVPIDNGFAIELDGRGIRTPAKAPLILPTEKMAAAIAGEWDAQDTEVDPRTMPVTLSANAAIDKVRVQKNEIVDLVADYGGTDLICYRAEGPAELVDRQAKAWDPLLRFAAEQLDAPLSVATGVIPRAQPKKSLSALHRQVAAFDPFQLTAFSELVSLSGSLVIGFAVAAGHSDAEALWRISRIDDLWQEEQWGADEEATATSEIKRQAFIHAVRFLRLSQ